MAAIRFTVDSPRSAEQVLADLTDFTERRPELWPAIDPRLYAVHAVTDDFAEVTEGTDVMGGIWARERYEWRPGHVRATIVDSNFWHPGGIWEATVTPAGVGCTVEVERDRQARVGKARVLELVMRLAGAKILASELAKAPAINGERVT